jgi:hypothetical protein
MTDPRNDIKQNILATLAELIADADFCSTEVKDLRHLNKMLEPVSLGWTLRRSPAAYYYWTHDSRVDNGHSVCVYTCKGTTLGFWLPVLQEVIQEEN